MQEEACMSVKIMNEVWDLQVTLAEKMVLMAIADAADDKGHAWPSFSHLERRCCMSRRSVIRCVNSLVDAGILSKEYRKRGNGSSTSNGYFINPDVQHQGGDTVSLGGVTECHQGSDTVSPPEPSLNHKNLSAVPRKTGAAKQVDDHARRKRAEHSWFICWFAWACTHLSGAKYVVTRADAGITQRLLASLGFEEVVNRACYYLTLPEKDRWPRGAPTLRGFAHQINAIAGKDSDESDRKAIAIGILPNDMNLPAFTPWKQEAAA